MKRIYDVKSKYKLKLFVVLVAKIHCYAKNQIEIADKSANNRNVLD